MFSVTLFTNGFFLKWPSYPAVQEVLFAFMDLLQAFSLARFDAPARSSAITVNSSDHSPPPSNSNCRSLTCFNRHVKPTAAGYRRNAGGPKTGECCRYSVVYRHVLLCTSLLLLGIDP